MSETLWTLHALPLAVDQDLPVIRMRARDFAGILGFSEQDRTRLSAAVSEVARQALHRGGGKVHFQVETAAPETYWIDVVTRSAVSSRSTGRAEHAPHGEADAIASARGLLDQLTMVEVNGQLHVRLGRRLPRLTAPLERGPLMRRVRRQLEATPVGDTASELMRQNRELVEVLNALRAQSEVLAQANLELEETNRGVVALHAELDARAEMLAQTSELKSRLVSLVSHEFRTPLGSIQMLAELLLTDGTHPLAAPHRAHIALIRQTAVELSEMVDDLLDLSKAQAGKLQVHPTLVHVEELFSALRVLLRPLTSASPVELRFELEEPLPPMFSDAPKLSLILRNLISNALKFTTEGEVIVRASAIGPDHLCFQVQDTGIGIAAEDLPRLFEDFRQLENPLQTEVKGTGLGLSLVRRFSEFLGGTVSVESEPGAGSIFTVRLPRVWKATGCEPLRDLPVAATPQRDAAVPTREPSTLPATPGPDAGHAPGDRAATGMRAEAYFHGPPRRVRGPRRVLVVDDDPAIRHLLAHHLQRLGCETLEAGDGAEGLYLARKEVPDLMLLDLEMPALTGWEVMPQLRAEPRTREVPVVIVSGRSRLEIDRANLDVQGVLSKHEASTELLRELSSLLDRLAPLEEASPHV